MEINIEKASQTVISQLVSQIVSVKTPNNEYSLGKNRPNEEESKFLRSNSSGFDNMSAILVLKDNIK